MIVNGIMYSPEFSARLMANANRVNATSSDIVISIVRREA